MFELVKKSEIKTIDDFIEEIINKFEKALEVDIINNLSKNSENLVDIIDEKDKAIMEVSAPGFSKDDIEISLKDNILIVKGERKEKSKRKYTQKEISRKINIAYELNEDKFNLEKIKSSLKDGILTIEIPKKEKEEKKENVKKIPIEGE